MLGLKLHQLGKAFVGASTTRVFDGGFKRGAARQVQQRAVPHLWAFAEGFDKRVAEASF
jgi:hypothetical protein